MEYEQRMEILDTITWPKPLAELLDNCFHAYHQHHPWIHEYPSPKSITREMLEGGDTFATFVRRYRLERSEGLVLRYLTDTWRTLDRSLPDDVYTDGLEDIVEWLGQLIRATDATLLDEWAVLAGKPVHEHLAPVAPAVGPVGPPPAWRTAVRTAAFGWVELLDRRSYPVLAERTGWTYERLATAMAPYWQTFDSIGIDGAARAAAHFSLEEKPDQWVITQQLVDPEGDGDWRFVATVDIAAALDEGAPVLVLQQLGPYESPDAAAGESLSPE